MWRDGAPNQTAELFIKDAETQQSLVICCLWTLKAGREALWITTFNMKKERKKSFTVWESNIYVWKINREREKGLNGSDPCQVYLGSGRSAAPRWAGSGPCWADRWRTRVCGTAASRPPASSGAAAPGGSCCRTEAHLRGDDTRGQHTVRGFICHLSGVLSSTFSRFGLEGIYALIMIKNRGLIHNNSCRNHPLKATKLILNDYQCPKFTLSAKSDLLQEK